MKSYTVYQTVENLLGVNTSHFVGCFFSKREALDVLITEGEFFEDKEDGLVDLYRHLGRKYKAKGCIFELWEYDGGSWWKGLFNNKVMVYPFNVTMKLFTTGEYL